MLRAIAHLQELDFKDPLVKIMPLCYRHKLVPFDHSTICNTYLMQSVPHLPAAYPLRLIEIQTSSLDPSLNITS